MAIAYEEGAPQEQLRKVRGVGERLGINYRLLLGGEASSCPVRVQFGVNVDVNLSIHEVSTLSPIGTALPSPKKPLLIR